MMTSYPVKFTLFIHYPKSEFDNFWLIYPVYYLDRHDGVPFEGRGRSLVS